MEMRAGRPPLLADMADEIALLQHLADLDVDLFHVDEGRVDVEAVVEDHRPAGQIEIGLGEAHHAGCWGDDRAPFGCGDVEAVMRLARLAVQDALRAVYAADRTLGRPDEGAEKVYV